MAGPFVNEELFDLKIKYIEKKLKSGHTGCVIVSDKETELKYKDHIKEIHTMWLQPNWKQSNDVIRKATKVDADTGIRGVDWPYYRTLLLENFMKTWDIAGEDGKTVPCIPENIAKLDPVIAGALVEEFLGKTSPSEEELKN